MKIDRHNYEEFFVLYTDNELNSDQRRMVEDFVQRNPDLKDELDILSQYKLTPDTEIVFENKTALFKSQTISAVNLVNYQEWMLLYIDNELADDQKKEFEKSLAENADLKKELDILQRTRLQPEKISFPDKSILFRKTERVRVISFYWKRVAAAVIFILLVAVGAVLINNKKSPSRDELTKTPVEKPGNLQPNQPAIKEEATPRLADNNSVVTETPVALNNKKEKTTEPVNSKINTTNYRVQKQPVQEKQHELIADNNTKTNNLPQPIENPNFTEGVAVNPSTNNGFKETQTPSVNTNDVTKTSTQPSNFVNASYKEDVPMEQTDGKKNKLRGLLRKVTRTFEKTTKVNATDENDRLLIGGLALKLK